MAQPKSSKQKRAAQNRASRQALAARRDNAQAATGGSTSSGGSSKGRSGGFFSRIFNPTPPSKAAGGSSSGGGGAAAGGARSAAAARNAALPPGHRAALSAVFAAVAAVVLCLVAVPVAVNANGDLYTREALAVDWSLSAVDALAEAPDATPAELVREIDEWTPGRESKPALVALWPWSLAVVFPVLGTVLGFRAVKRRAPGKTVSRYMFLTLLGVLTTTQLAFLFLPSVVALGIAMYQVRKWETQNAVVTGDPSTGEVIEADVVD
ncbi:MAG: hypothetical protein M3Z03_13040, partial [Actinomycetota bacterium]|nr:hypothetical protein [Actinomycetota bacterium]